MASVGCDLDLYILTQRKVRVNLNDAFSESLVGDVPPLTESSESTQRLKLLNMNITTNETVMFKFGDMLRLECNNGDLPKRVCLLL
jgi:hypothetical protein